MRERHPDKGGGVEAAQATIWAYECLTDQSPAPRQGPPPPAADEQERAEERSRARAGERARAKARRAQRTWKVRDKGLDRVIGDFLLGSGLVEDGKLVSAAMLFERYQEFAGPRGVKSSSHLMRRLKHVPGLRGVKRQNGNYWRVEDAESVRLYVIEHAKDKEI